MRKKKAAHRRAPIAEARPSIPAAVDARGRPAANYGVKASFLTDEMTLGFLAWVRDRRAEVRPPSPQVDDCDLTLHAAWEGWKAAHAEAARQNRDMLTALELDGALCEECLPIVRRDMTEEAS